MWFWKALSEERLLAMHLVASFVAVIGMLSSLAFGWAYMTVVWHASCPCSC